MQIFVLKSAYSRSDFDSDLVEVTVDKTDYVPGMNVTMSGYEVIHTDKGIYHRFDCYSEYSPYGWVRGEPTNE